MLMKIIFNKFHGTAAIFLLCSTSKYITLLTNFVQTSRAKWLFWVCDKGSAKSWTKWEFSGVHFRQLSSEVLYLEKYYFPVSDKSYLMYDIETRYMVSTALRFLISSWSWLLSAAKETRPLLLLLSFVFSERIRQRHLTIVCFKFNSMPVKLS